MLVAFELYDVATYFTIPAVAAGRLLCKAIFDFMLTTRDCATMPFATLLGFGERTGLCGPTAILRTPPLATGASPIRLVTSVVLSVTIQRVCALFELMLHHGTPRMSTSTLVLSLTRTSPSPLRLLVVASATLSRASQFSCTPP